MTGPVGLDPVVWAAAQLAAGHDMPDAPTAAHDLVALAAAVADRDVMDDVVDHLDAEHVPSGKGGPRVSDYDACGRAVWYRETPPDDLVTDEVDRRRAALGSIVHQAAATARAARYPWRSYELEVTVPGLDRPGKVDEYDPILGEVVDNKTAGASKWRMIGDEGPQPGAWGQVLIYGLALAAAGYPVRTVRIIVINRDTGAEEHFRTDYDPAAAEAALDELVTLAMTIELGAVPARAGSGPGQFPCSWCEYRSHCWQIPAATAAGRSPESYTVLGADPDAAAIVWAAQQRLAAAAARLAADKAAAAAQALVDGLEGVYGEGPDAVQLARTGGWFVPDYKASFERLSALYALPEEYRPPVAEATAPVTRRVPRRTEVTRPRAAARKPKKPAKVAAAPVEAAT